MRGSVATGRVATGRLATDNVKTEVTAESRTEPALHTGSNPAVQAGSRVDELVLQTRPVQVQHTAPVQLPERPPAAAPDIRRTIGDTDLTVHPLALGCSVFGWTTDGDTAMAILDRHWELGGNFLDTADSYAAGRSEVLIGSWMRTRGVRDDTIISTKIGRNRDNPGLSPRSIVGAVHASLERLGTDRIDLLHFHFDDLDVPLEESLGAMETLIARGTVRHLAASNFTAERLMEARVLAANGLPRFVALETPYNLMNRVSFESSLALVTRAQGVAVMPYFALAHGFLTGKYHSKADLTDTIRAGRASAYLNRAGLKVLGVLERIAEDHGVAPSTIALAWLLAKDGVVAPVASASRPDQVDALVAAAAVRLGRADMVDLDKVSA
ncbi:aldo/keto reductase [Cryobacterium adonitolivorans]|uniref:Aldo/keto reductase n=1 Tax=Cryobacterium adonitolivorans TaxID=1259189 RepID=A0A4R8W2B9_9MICO|nr:aldo/keto reductase [Cryobacterium adonitolivorans]